MGEISKKFKVPCKYQIPPYQTSEGETAVSSQQPAEVAEEEQDWRVKTSLKAQSRTCSCGHTTSANRSGREDTRLPSRN